MANIEVKKVEEQLDHRLLLSVRVNADEGHMEFPLAIQDHGSSAANEAAVLASTLAFAEELEAAARLPLGASASRTSLSIHICGKYEGAACRLATFEPRIGLIGPTGKRAVCRTRPRRYDAAQSDHSICRRRCRRPVA